MNLKAHIAIISELGKMRITSFVALSTSIGYILFVERLELFMLLPILGVFLLACGSSVINHLQEKKFDLLMDRTKSRPLPSKKISPAYALLTALVFTILGMLILYFAANLTSMILGLVALVWYNIIYTPMKRRSALAVVPGSLIGAIPPVIGWTAAGGDPFALEILAVALFFFIWQIPHFWLLLLMYDQDYIKAGFPTLTKVFTNLQLSRITFVWIAALVCSCMLIPYFHISKSIISLVVFMLLGIILLWMTKPILNRYLERVVFRTAFIHINVYVLLVVFVLSLDKLLFTEF